MFDRYWPSVRHLSSRRRLAIAYFSEHICFDMQRLDGLSPHIVRGLEVRRIDAEINLEPQDQKLCDTLPVRAQTNIKGSIHIVLISSR